MVRASLVYGLGRISSLTLLPKIGKKEECCYSMDYGVSRLGLPKASFFLPHANRKQKVKVIQFLGGPFLLLGPSLITTLTPAQNAKIANIANSCIKLSFYPAIESAHAPVVLSSYV